MSIPRAATSVQMSTSTSHILKASRAALQPNQQPSNPNPCWVPFNIEDSRSLHHCPHSCEHTARILLRHGGQPADSAVIVEKGLQVVAVQIGPTEHHALLHLFTEDGGLGAWGYYISQAHIVFVDELDEQQQLEFLDLLRHRVLPRQRHVGVHLVREGLQPIHWLQAIIHPSIRIQSSGSSGSGRRSSYRGGGILH